MPAMRRCAIILMTLALSSVAHAGTTLAELVPAYQRSAAAERVTLRVSDTRGATSEVITVWTDPEHEEATVRFAGLRAFLSRDSLVVERADDRSRAFVAPVEGSPAGTFREHLPGVPAVQIALLFGQPDEAPWPLGEAASDAKVFASPEGRLRFATVDLGQGRRATLTVDVAAEEAARLDAPDPDELTTRRLVRSVEALVDPPGAEPALVRPGDDAPALLLLGIDLRPWILGSRDAGAVAMVLCRRQTPGAGAGFGAALDVAERDDAPLGYTAVLGVCGEPFDRPIIDHLRDLRDRWGAGVLWTVSPETTIDRFAPDADAVLVVIDALDTVRAVIELDGRGADQPDIEREIVAALERRAP